MTKCLSLCFLFAPLIAFPIRRADLKHQYKMAKSNLDMSGFHTPSKNFPKLAVFDLDYTLWPFWVDTHPTPPFKKTGDRITDSRGMVIEHYKDVFPVLEFLKSHNVKIAAASRTSEIKGAQQLCHLMHLDDYFDYKEIFPDCKLSHFANLKKASGVDYKDMIFFDDEDRNIVDISPLGVTCVLVTNGMKKSCLNEGLKQWERAQSHR